MRYIAHIELLQAIKKRINMISKKDAIKKELEDSLKKGYGPKVARFAISFLGGLVPIGGGAIGGIASAWSEKESDDFKKVLAAWLKLQEEEINEIGQTLYEIMIRLDLNDTKIDERIKSPEYLSLVKKCFKDWSATESEEKRVLIRNLLANSASSNLTTDDVLRLFIEWIEKYSESHFKIITEIYKNSNAGITRYQIWMNLHGKIVREDSPEADLFKLIIHDLSMGQVIRQFRPTDYYGKFLKQTMRHTNSSSTLTSAFENTKPYVLTELGKQFVHYTMNEIVPKLTEGKKEE
jgi:hypothetical protein